MLGTNDKIFVRKNFIMKISACIITCNEERDLPRCLRSLQPVVDEIVVVDSGSADRTREVVDEFKARWVSHPWAGYVGQKNFAIAQASHAWVLSVDADEELSPALQESLRALREQPPSFLSRGYRVSRVVCYREKWIRHGDWYPDYLVRFFQRDWGRFTGGRVHERLVIEGGTPLLAGELWHYTYADREDRKMRIENYAHLWAESAYEQGRRCGRFTPWLHAAGRWLRGYVLRQGFMDGAVGLDIANGNAREVFLKYRQLRDLWR